MKRKGLALSRRLASCLLAATLAAGLAAPQAAVYAGEPDAILEEETESGEDMYTGPDEDVPEETEDPSLDLYPDAAEDSYSEPYSDPYVDASPYIDPSEDAENADAPIEDTAQEGLVPEGASGEEAQYEEAPENDEYQEGAVDAESARSRSKRLLRLRSSKFPPTGPRMTVRMKEPPSWKTSDTPLPSRPLSAAVSSLR